MPQRTRSEQGCGPHRPGFEVSAWTSSQAKRLTDVFAAALLLLLLAPLLAILYCIVRAGSRGPAIFNQERVGKDLTRFTVHKFRTMVHNPDSAGYLRPKPGDGRLTPQGAFLRKYKLDELPQLINVLRGEMSFVGPRPKLPELHFGPLPCRPGLTGKASLAFAAEAHLLKDVPDHLHEGLHTSLITPLKLTMDTEYMRIASFRSDLAVLCETILLKGRCLDLAMLEVQPEIVVENA